MPERDQTTDLTLATLVERTDLTGYAITRHGYRQMRVIGSAVTDGPYDYDAGDKFSQLQYRLAAAVGERIDNHETYVVEVPGTPNKLCLWFHDWRLIVGTSTHPY